ncbi:rRNA maturation RNase YbeY [Gammaproteobacteria bacterium]|mgnify:CR=1 FL=1|nr:rRNA maturation RNase YbeY [Gammaproteobacteria bacterium]MDA7802307.1 rRNA maturation RNase YbeY [Gammaproteobacteria bacterium]MDA7856314.1 rRNA maturation RNase YbeY [Gammaproteobacteria bacterium]MDA8696769.1 rRNA maturation RNase YbeY [Gammaproteobacteria bacterium]MDA8856474.1 rRNA maturation RNase YbeY [Gammaproteobacteria bacterium]
MNSLNINDTYAKLSSEVRDKLSIIASNILNKEGSKLSSVNLKIVTNKEIAELNKIFRGKDSPTNVLSFTNDDISKNVTNSLGDIAISYEFVEVEAVKQGKNISDHLMHMLAHGLYHILGYNHENEAEASIMEEKEILILDEQKIKNPYL